MRKFTFNEFVEGSPQWDADTQLGVLTEFIHREGLSDKLNEFVSEKYGHEFDDDDKDED